MVTKEQVDCEVMLARVERENPYSASVRSRAGVIASLADERDRLSSLVATATSLLELWISRERPFDSTLALLERIKKGT